MDRLRDKQTYIRQIFTDPMKQLLKNTIVNDRNLGSKNDEKMLAKKKADQDIRLEYGLDGYKVKFRFFKPIFKHNQVTLVKNKSGFAARLRTA